MSDDPMTAEVGLDALFERPRGAQVRRGQSVYPPGARWLVGRLFFAIALAAVIDGLLYIGRLVVPFALLATTIFVVTLLKQALTGIAARPLPRQLTGRGLRPMDPDAPAPPGAEETDGIAVAVGRWNARLAGSGGPFRRGTSAVWLGDLVDERLRLRHGVTRVSDPQRAREMMGEHLWRMLQDPSAGGPTPRDMAAMLNRIEEL
jgi:hypothetical protein